MKKTEEKYSLTFKGFCTLQFKFDEVVTDHFLDALELWMRRADLNAILLDPKTGGFDAKKIYLEVS
jgi:hypothetical protein